MDLLLVNVSSKFAKKPWDNLFQFSHTINYGILALATYLSRFRYEVTIFDPATSGPDPLDVLLKEIDKYKPFAVGLSCISGFSYPETKTLATTIKQYYPETLLIVGGKDHVGTLAHQVLLDCPAIDVVVRGDGELVLLRLLTALERGDPLTSIPNLVLRHCGEILSTQADPTFVASDIPMLDYRLYPSFDLFPLSIEVGRGCPYRCSFCVSARTPVRKKPVPAIIEEAVRIADLLCSDSPKIYLETPMFLMTDVEIGQLARLRKRSEILFTWRAQMRVDYLNSRRLRLLSNAGLRVIDLGFESGSPEILLRMNKTKDPARYLAKTEEILRTADSCGILIKLNVLFYIGERQETLTETWSFLERNRRYVHALSAYPLLLYPGMDFSGVLDEQLKLFGGRIEMTQPWLDRRVFPVYPSSHFTYDQLLDEGLRMARNFQDAEAYFLQKTYGYFSPTTTFEDFMREVKILGAERLPFRVIERSNNGCTKE